MLSLLSILIVLIVNPVSDIQVVPLNFDKPFCEPIHLLLLLSISMLLTKFEGKFEFDVLYVVQLVSSNFERPPLLTNVLEVIHFTLLLSIAIEVT